MLEFIILLLMYDVDIKTYHIRYINQPLTKEKLSKLLTVKPNFCT